METEIIESRNQKIGNLIKSEMNAQGMSLRGLSGICGISPSTLHRILNGKQEITLFHLRLFSQLLNIPIALLLGAAGIEAFETKVKEPFIIDLIGGILESFDIDLNNLLTDIQKELKKYERYAKTEDGKDKIITGFEAKISSLHAEGIVIKQFKALYEFYKINENPEARGVAGSALLYLIWTPDIIPDYAFPLGYLDDAIAAALSVKRLSEEFNITLEL